MALTLSTQRASSSFFSNELAPGWKYDVFLSFRGVDTRKGFVSHLYHELYKCQGITTFYDDQELERGTSISPEILSAIEASHTAIVVLSPNYAYSKWCLDELTKIVQCVDIMPIFYDVDPSDVGNQRGSFAKAFVEHEEKFTSTEDKKKVTQWRADLKEVSKISGWHLKNFKSERELIDDIVECVWRKVQATFTLLDSSQKLVGTDYALEQLSLLLAHDASDVRFIGITGMGGIGKTTLAKLVYDKIFHHFEVHCFLENVREVSITDRTLVCLQQQILKENIVRVRDQQSGINYMKKCLCNKKVLLVLDDVDQVNQLQVLAGKKDWFGTGSRIIITTRNQRLLVEHDVTLCHNVEVLNDAEALELFSLHAFRKEQPKEDFLELSKHFLDYARGLPVVLKTLGSSLYARGQDAWNSVRDNLRKIPIPTVFDSLKVSYDGLEKTEKRIFLDVACFHKGKSMTEVLRKLDNSFGISSSSMIDVLIERSLIYNGYGNGIWMHDLIQEMAWAIVHEESEEPGLRSRLWLSDDIFHILTTNSGSRAIEAISLCLFNVEEVPQWNCEAFSKMHGLRFLEFANLIFSSGPKFLPCSLRIINWSSYPSKFLPTSFRPYLLTELNMPCSNLVRLWEGKMDLPSLKYINLEGSNKLKSTPDFSGLPNLEKLDLSECKNLVEMHPTIAVLKKLKVLNLRGCQSIKSLPGEIEMDSLEYFCLGRCSNVKKIPEFGQQMKNVSCIVLDETAIEEIPSSIGHLVGLKQLYVRNCKNLLNLPMAIYSLKSLEYLEFDQWGEGSDAKARDGCGLLRCLGLGKSRPDPPRRDVVLSSLNRLCFLRKLSLSDCQLYEGDIPDDIGCLSFLQELNLSGNNFVSLPESIRCLSKLGLLYLMSCKSLQELPPLPSERYLLVLVQDCTSLKRLLEPSKMMSRYTCINGRESFCYAFICLNNIALAQDEGWILSMILKFAAEVSSLTYSLDANLCHHCLQFDPVRMISEIVIPRSEIPEWFCSRRMGHSINVLLPPPSYTNWLGIAFGVVFQDPKQNLANPAALPHCDKFKIRCSVKTIYRKDVTYKIGSLMSEHLGVFYLDREDCQQGEFLFETYICNAVSEVEFGEEVKAELNTVKECGARLVYKQDLEELCQNLKILK